MLRWLRRRRDTRKPRKLRLTENLETRYRTPTDTTPKGWHTDERLS